MKKRIQRKEHSKEERQSVREREQERGGEIEGMWYRPASRLQTAERVSEFLQNRERGREKGVE